MANPDDFDEWMNTEAKNPNGRGAPVWDSWPEVVREELERALARNDESPDRRVPLASLLTRWKRLYEVEITRDTACRYCRNVLGRKNYTQRE